jgi:CDP-paratose 2-epimerase
MAREMLVIGGAGFIGINAADRFAADGWRVTVLDNLSRRGAERNLEWLRRRRNIGFIKADIRDATAMDRALSERRYDAVLHLAAQVAVTSSVVNPREDFEINALGTLNVLEAIRQHAPGASIIFASTNKVYGKLEALDVVERNGRYAYAEADRGVAEDRGLDFHSPYGCSKGAADQYMIDYSRIYGMKTTVFRQSCIYGPHQFGVEDQGWVAWFAIAALLGKKLTIYGDGKQVRDVLHVDDLLSAYAAVLERPDTAAGQSFNIGGGPANTLSLLELIELLQRRLGAPIAPAFADWRPGDQRVYVSDIAKLHHLLDWQPQIGVAQGVGQLVEWIGENRTLFE